MADLMSLTYVRLFDFSVWALVAICLLPSAIRFFTKKRGHCDDYRTALFFVALWVAGNYAVRLAGETSIYTLQALNALAAALAVYVLILVRQGSRQNDRCE
jgi:hypothetical protein